MIIGLERGALDRWGKGDPDVRVDRRWKILHSHWSYTKPDIK